MLDPCPAAGRVRLPASRRRRPSLGGFGIDPGEKRDQWLEGLQVAVRAMTETLHWLRGLLREPSRPANVVPKPMAEAPPRPLWVACRARHHPARRRQGHRRPRLRLHRPREEARHWSTTTPRSAAERCVPVGKRSTNIACVTPMMCAPTEDEATPWASEGGNYRLPLAHYYVRVRRPRARRDQRPGRVHYARTRWATPRPPSPPRRRCSAPRSRPATRRVAGVRTPAQIRGVPAPLRGGRRRPGDLRPAAAATATRTSWPAARPRRRGAAPSLRRAHPAASAPRPSVHRPDHRGAAGGARTTPHRCPTARHAGPAQGHGGGRELRRGRQFPQDHGRAERRRRPTASPTSPADRPPSGGHAWMPTPNFFVLVTETRGQTSRFRNQNGWCGGSSRRR